MDGVERVLINLAIWEKRNLFCNLNKSILMAVKPLCCRDQSWARIWKTRAKHTETEPCLLHKAVELIELGRESHQRHLELLGRKDEKVQNT